jgi:hypothetical protein
LEADTILAHEMPRKPQRDTRRSWRILRRTVAWLCAGVAALVGYGNFQHEHGPGNSEVEILEFETSLHDDVYEMDRTIEILPDSNFASNNSRAAKFTWLFKQQFSEENLIQYPAIKDYLASDGRVGRAYGRLSPRNQTFAGPVMTQAFDMCRERAGSCEAAPPEFDPLAEWPLVPWQSQAPNPKWVITSDIVAEGLGFAAVWAIGIWLTAWLFITALAGMWWFFIARLRDIAGAVKGE